jgi:myosin heavy subunit
MRKTQILIKSCSLLAVGFLGGLWGCQLKPATAVHNEIQSKESHLFPKKNLTLLANNFFIWKEGIKQDEIPKMMELMDQYEGPLRKINQIKRKLDYIADIEQKILKEKTTVDESKFKIRKQNQALKKINRELEKKKNEENELKKKSLPPPVAEIDQVHQEIGDLEKKAQDFSDELAALKLEVSTAQAEVNRLTALPEYQEREEVQKEKMSLAPQGLDFKDQAKLYADSVVTLNELKVEFQKDQSISFKIEGWGNLEVPASLSFSTESKDGKKPTINHVQYQEDGGVLEFRVLFYEDEKQENLQELYLFRVERAVEARFMGKVKRVRANPDGTKLVSNGLAQFIGSETIGK